MSESKYGSVQYFCDLCKKTRLLKILQVDHLNIIQTSPNGLALYSDIHICSNGISGVNNLQIDGNYHVRSYQAVKLPEYQPQRAQVPKPGMKKSDMKHEFRIIDLPFNRDLDLIIDFNSLDSRIIIGKRQFVQNGLSNENALYHILSDFTRVSMTIYSISSRSEYIEDWFSQLANTLELIPATRLGLIIESLKYISDICENQPSGFDVSFLRTILTSHEVYFLIDDISELMNLPARYPEMFDSENMELIENFIAILMDNQLLSLQEFNQMVDKDLIYLIYLLLLLEKEKIIVIERPGIVEY